MANELAQFSMDARRPQSGFAAIICSTSLQSSQTLPCIPAMGRRCQVIVAANAQEIQRDSRSKCIQAFAYFAIRHERCSRDESNLCRLNSTVPAAAVGDSSGVDSDNPGFGSGTCSSHDTV